MAAFCSHLDSDGHLTRRLIADRERLIAALSADLSSNYCSEALRTDPVRSFLFRAVSRQRCHGLLTDDVFETMLKKAQSITGRNHLLAFFNAPEGLAA